MVWRSHPKTLSSAPPFFVRGFPSFLPNPFFIFSLGLLLVVIFLCTYQKIRNLALNEGRLAEIFLNPFFSLSLCKNKRGGFKDPFYRLLCSTKFLALGLFSPLAAPWGSCCRVSSSFGFSFRFCKRHTDRPWHLKLKILF